MIPICLILFILFIAVITFAIKRADSAQAKVTEEFWEKERKANSPLRGDTTDLCYITIPEKFFPLNYICLFNYLFISSQMSAKPYFIGSTGILPLW